MWYGRRVTGRRKVGSDRGPVSAHSAFRDPLHAGQRVPRHSAFAGRSPGFTLIELLVVVVIIGLLAGLVGPRLFGRVGKSKQAAAQAQIELFGAALDNYRLDVGKYPTGEAGLKALQTNPGVDGWDGPYLKKELPSDPWGRAYVYRSPGEHGEYDVMSYGADGAPGGEGEDTDIVSWQVVQQKKSGP